MKVLSIHTYYQEKGGEDTVFETEKARLRLNGVEIKSLKFNNSKHAFFKILFYHFNWWSYFLVIREAKRFKPDLIHIHNLHFAASPAVLWAAAFCKVPVVMTLHNFRLICPSAILYHNGDLFLDSLQGGFAWKAVVKKVYKNSYVLTFWLASGIWLHKMMGTWKKVQKFILLTEFSKEIYLQSDFGIPESRMTVKPNFIHVHSNNSPVKKAGFVYVGRLSEEKGIDTLIAAFEELPFDLTILGDGPLREEIKTFAAAHQNKVKFLGFQNNLVVQEVLKSASALLFTSKSFEGMPMTIIEALASGTPVIASSLGSIPSMLTAHVNSLFFEPGNAQDLAARIEQWKAFSQEVRNGYYKNALQTYQARFSPEVNLQEILAIYNEAIS